MKAFQVAVLFCGFLFFCAQSFAEKLTAADAGQLQSVADSFVTERWLTRWQLSQLMAGRTTFFLEKERYLLLNQIGKGGWASSIWRSTFALTATLH